MSLLSRVTSTAQVLPPRTFFYAREKWGKSSAFAHAPGVIYFMTRGETGLVELIAGGRVPPTPHFAYDEATPPTWETLRDAVRELINEDHAYRHFVVDTCNGAEILCQEYVRNNFFKGSHNAFASYGKGWDSCRVQWLGLLQDLDELRAKRRMAITLLAHTKVKKFDDPTQDEGYDKYTPACQEKLWDLTHKWSDIICFGHFKTQTYESESGKTKAKSDVRRVICFNQSPTWEAGNRYGISGELDVSDGAAAGFKKFDAVVEKARASNFSQQAEDARKRFAAAETLADLGKAWSALPAEVQKLVLADKDCRKAELQAATPAPAPVPTQAPAAPPPPVTTGSERNPTDAEVEAASTPAPKTMPGADRTTSEPRVGGELVGKILPLLAEVGIDWPQIRDDRDDGKGVAALCGFTPLAGLRIASLSAEQALKLFRWAEARKAEKDAKKRQSKQPEEALA